MSRIEIANKNGVFVSICLLTYNRAADLYRSINSILRQTHNNFELIINDDRSTDDTEKICREYERVDNRVKYYKNATNRKYAGNSNLAIERASSNYVAILHDGDEYDDRLIEIWLQGMLKYTSAGIAFCANNTMDFNWKVKNRNTHNYQEFINGKDLLKEMLYRFECPIWGIVMVKKSCILKIGYFDESKPRLTDVDMWMRILAENDAFYSNQSLINIAPRELEHENYFVNWDIYKEIVEIRRLNILRNKLLFKKEFKKLRLKFNFDLFHYYFRYLFSCIIRFRIIIFWNGIKRFFEFLKYIL